MMWLYSVVLLAVLVPAATDAQVNCLPAFRLAGDTTDYIICTTKKKFTAARKHCAAMASPPVRLLNVADEAHAKSIAEAIKTQLSTPQLITTTPGPFWTNAVKLPFLRTTAWPDRYMIDETDDERDFTENQPRAIFTGPRVIEKSTTLFSRSYAVALQMDTRWFAHELRDELSFVCQRGPGPTATNPCAGAGTTGDNTVCRVGGRCAPATTCGTSRTVCPPPADATCTAVVTAPVSLPQQSQNEATFTTALMAVPVSATGPWFESLSCPGGDVDSLPNAGSMSNIGPLWPFLPNIVKKAALSLMRNAGLPVLLGAFGTPIHGPRTIELVSTPDVVQCAAISPASVVTCNAVAVSDGCAACQSLIAVETRCGFPIAVANAHFDPTVWSWFNSLDRVTPQRFYRMCVSFQNFVSPNTPVTFDAGQAITLTALYSGAQLEAIGISTPPPTTTTLAPSTTTLAPSTTTLAPSTTSSAAPQQRRRFVSLDQQGTTATLVSAFMANHPRFQRTSLASGYITWGSTCRRSSSDQHHSVVVGSILGRVLMLGPAAGSATESGYVDGPAATAQFRCPSSVAWINSSRTLYIADSGNACLRSLARGVVHTVAGRCTVPGRADGYGPDARFTDPALIRAVEDMDLVVADVGLGCFRMVRARFPIPVVERLAGVCAPRGTLPTDVEGGSVDGLLDEARMFDVDAMAVLKRDWIFFATSRGDIREMRYDYVITVRSFPGLAVLDIDTLHQTASSHVLMIMNDGSLYVVNAARGEYNKSLTLLGAVLSTTLPTGEAVVGFDAGELLMLAKEDTSPPPSPCRACNATCFGKCCIDSSRCEGGYTCAANGFPSTKFVCPSPSCSAQAVCQLFNASCSPPQVCVGVVACEGGSNGGAATSNCNSLQSLTCVKYGSSQFEICDFSPLSGLPEKPTPSLTLTKETETPSPTHSATKTAPTLSSSFSRPSSSDSATESPSHSLSASESATSSLTQSTSPTVSASQSRTRSTSLSASISESTTASLSESNTVSMSLTMSPHTCYPSNNVVCPANQCLGKCCLASGECQAGSCEGNDLRDGVEDCNAGSCGGGQCRKIGTQPLSCGSKCLGVVDGGSYKGWMCLAIDGNNAQRDSDHFRVCNLHSRYVHMPAGIPAPTQCKHPIVCTDLCVGDCCLATGECNAASCPGNSLGNKHLSCRWPIADALLPGTDECHGAVVCEKWGTAAACGNKCLGATKCLTPACAGVMPNTLCVATDNGNPAYAQGPRSSEFDVCSSKGGF